MAKYKETLRVARTETGKRYYSTVIPEDITLTDNVREHTARMGERWDTLAHRYYGKAALWYRIANANGGVNGSMFIKPGTIIKIPEV